MDFYFQHFDLQGFSWEVWGEQLSKYQFFRIMSNKHESGQYSRQKNNKLVVNILDRKITSGQYSR